MKYEIWARKDNVYNLLATIEGYLEAHYEEIRLKKSGHFDFVCKVNIAKNPLAFTKIVL